MSTREPLLRTVPIAELRPTQVTVGCREVAEKRRGWAKETVPFTEFMWADALRRRIRRREVDESFSAALLKALEFAKGRDARYLPGWCGPNDGS